jgi:hypothetical protein
MGDVSEISMKVNKVDVHNSTSGWTTVSNTSRTYNLLDLKAKNESKLLAEIKTKSGVYDRVRIQIEGVLVKEKMGTVKEALLPSGNLDINTNLVVSSGKISSVNMDFLADKSLFKSDKGQYVFAPVVKTETRSNADVTVDANGTVLINGGSVDDTSTMGMNLDGNIKLNFMLDPNQKIEIKADNTFNLEGLLK